jgi:uncharacterized damage-inducible protein DinB
MSPQTISEKDQFLGAFEREYETTRRLLQAYPAEQYDLRPKPNMRSAKEIAWMLVLNQQVEGLVLQLAELKPGNFPQPPTTWPELIRAFETMHAETVAKIRGTDDAVWNQDLKMPVGPKQMGEMRRGDAAWFFLMDTIHHRGQFSVYARFAGAKVPSIYGPSADEPWN